MYSMFFQKKISVIIPATDVDIMDIDYNVWTNSSNVITHEMWKSVVMIGFEIQYWLNSV